VLIRFSVEEPLSLSVANVEATELSAFVSFSC